MEIVTMRPAAAARQSVTVTGWSKLAALTAKPPPTTPELSILDDDAEGSIDTVTVPNKRPQPPPAAPLHKTCSTHAVPVHVASFLDDVDSSDDEEDYRQCFRRYFRPRQHDADAATAAAATAAAAAATTSAVAATAAAHADADADEHSALRGESVAPSEANKRGRSTRQNNASKTAAGKLLGRMTPSELPFADAKNRKPLQLSASPEEIEDDLLLMQGRPKRRRVEQPRQKLLARKRRRTGSADGCSLYASDGENGAECKGASSQSTAPVDQPSSEKKKGRTEGKLFMKHAERKGWVVCRKCRASVWPPNCAKHVANCMM